MSVGEHSKRIGCAKSSTSFTSRFSRAISSSMSAAASRRSAALHAGLDDGAQRALDDHQRVADLVRDHRGEAAQRGQPLALGGLALEAGDGVGQAVERPGQHLGIVVVPAVLTGELELAGEVAALGHLPHVIGDARRAGRVTVRATQ